MAMASRGFYLACLLLGALGFLCVLCTTYWAQHWRGGFAWDGGQYMFNWHPVLMVSGMVVLYGAASLVYRLPQAWLGPRLPWKALHAALHLGAFVLTVVGLVAVFRYHSRARITHLYSLHSWLGLAATILFACQWFLGFAVFLLPWASLWLRSLLKPLHVFFGAAILSLSMASVISGINEKLFFSLKNATTPYQSLPSEAIFANSTGLLVVAFGILVLYVLLASSWKCPEPGVLADRQVWLRSLSPAGLGQVYGAAQEGLGGAGCGGITRTGGSGEAAAGGRVRCHGSGLPEPPQFLWLWPDEGKNSLLLCQPQAVVVGPDRCIVGLRASPQTWWLGRGLQAGSTNPGLCPLGSPCCATGNDVGRGSRKLPLVCAPRKSHPPGPAWGLPPSSQLLLTLRLALASWQGLLGLCLGRTLLPWPLLLAAFAAQIGQFHRKWVLGFGRVQPV